MANVVVLGCGFMGPIIVKDLAGKDGHSVKAVDAREEAGKSIAGIPNATFERADLSDIQKQSQVVAGADLVVGALPGGVGFSALRRLLEAGCKRIVDISFMPEEPARLNDLAVKNGCVAVVDVGVGPGLSNMLATRLAASVAAAESLDIYVGGLPRKRRWPFEYVTVFSPRDVVEEYTRPARIMEAGKIVLKPALSDLELVDFDELGTLEAFLTDGLRSLLATLPIPNMKEKTMRYPGHAEIMRVLRDAGFFSEEYIDISGRLVRPLEVTARLLETAWKAEPGELDLTALRMVLKGKDEKGRSVRLGCEMVDVVDNPEGFSSMARTTGYTCTAVARALLADHWTEPGIIFPERLGARVDLLDAVLSDLTERGIDVRFSKSTSDQH